MQSRRACFLPLVLICLTPAGSHGQLTYQVVPRDGKEALWSLDGGWIMTDGTIGEIGLENITSWDLRFSSPSGQASISSEAGGIYLFKLNNSIDDSVPAPDVPSFQATSDNLILNPKLGELQYLMFATEDPFLDGFRGNFIGFTPRLGGTVSFANGRNAGGLLIDNTIDSGKPFHPYISYMASPNQASFDIPAGPLIVATTQVVPEPDLGYTLIWVLAIATQFRVRMA